MTDDKDLRAALEQARLGICPVCQNRFRDDGHAYDCPLSASATDEGLRAALTAIRDLTLDVPAAHGDPESYYLGQLRTAIGTAARALAASTTKDPK